MKQAANKKPRLNDRAASVHQIMNTNFKTLDFEGEWLNLLGCPELKGGWIIWGHSFNGKTSLALQLCKYLSKFAKVAYNSLEEGLSKSMKSAIIRTGMDGCRGNFILLDREPLALLRERLSKKKSPRVIVIDSWQFTGGTYADYQQLINDFPNKLFIIISHADGKNPSGSVAKKIRYDAFVKIWVEGYKAFANSRYGGGKPYTIYDKGAYEYWGETENN